MDKARRQGLRTGRPLGFAPDMAVDRAVEVFWTRGYDGATMVLLEEATALSRSSLLNTFGPKNELFLTVLDRYLQMADDQLLAPLRTGRGGLDDVRAFFTALAKLKESAPGSCGCLIVNTAADPPPGVPHVQQRIDRYHEALTEAMTAALDRAVHRGEIHTDQIGWRAEVLAALAVAVNWTARAHGPSPARQLARSAHAMVEDWRVR